MFSLNVFEVIIPDTSLILQAVRTSTYFKYIISLNKNRMQNRKIKCSQCPHRLLREAPLGHGPRSGNTATSHRRHVASYITISAGPLHASKPRKPRGTGRRDSGTAPASKPSQLKSVPCEEADAQQARALFLRLYRTLERQTCMLKVLTMLGDLGFRRAADSFLAIQKEGTRGKCGWTWRVRCWGGLTPSIPPVHLVGAIWWPG